jgi:hypothetical protein
MWLCSSFWLSLAKPPSPRADQGKLSHGGFSPRTPLLLTPCTSSTVSTTAQTRRRGSDCLLILASALELRVHSLRWGAWLLSWRAVECYFSCFQFSSGVKSVDSANLHRVERDEVSSCPFFFFFFSFPFFFFFWFNFNYLKWRADQGKVRRSHGASPHELRYFWHRVQ